MHFELTKALINDILFSMEDQEGDFVIDTVEGTVSDGLDDTNFDDEKDSERYVVLPEWDSADGFRLMEHFAAVFRNPLVRNELSAALDRGKGVFRAFKDVLGRYPEAEKFWFSFKEKEMKKRILSWYNGLREEWGLEKIGGEPEDTDDLVLEDFRFRPFREDDAAAAEELHRACVEEQREAFTKNGAGFPAEAVLRETREFLFRSKNLLPTAGIIAESSGGEFAGSISGTVKEGVLYVNSLEVRPEYRGLGIGEALLSRFLDSVAAGDASHAFVDLPFWAEGFSRVLLREKFTPYAVRYRLDMRERLP